MVCRGAQVSGAQKLGEGTPQVAFKLPASISGNSGRCAKTGYPSGDNAFSTVSAVISVRGATRKRREFAQSVM